MKHKIFKDRIARKNAHRDAAKTCVSPSIHSFRTLHLASEWHPPPPFPPPLNKRFCKFYAASTFFRDTYALRPRSSSAFQPLPQNDLAGLHFDYIAYHLSTLCYRSNGGHIQSQLASDTICPYSNLFCALPNISKDLTSDPE